MIRIRSLRRAATEMEGRIPPSWEENPIQGGGSNNGKWKYKIVMLEKKFRNQKRQLSVFNTLDKPGSDDEDLDGL